MMKKSIRYKIFFLGVLFFTIYSNQSLAINKFNTTITIHYEKEADKESTRFQQYERYALKDYSIIEAPKHSLEDEELKTVIKLNLDKPSQFLLGVDIIYVLPNENIDIDYFVLKNTREEFRDSFHVNFGSILILRHGHLPDYFNWSFIELLKNVKNKQQVDSILNIETIASHADSSISNINLNYLNPGNLQSMLKYFKLFYIESYCNKLLGQLRDELPRMNDDLKDYSIRQVMLLMETLGKLDNDREFLYWVTMKFFYKEILNDKFKKNDYQYDSIKDLIAHFNDTTKQYFLLQAAKSYSILPAQNKDNLNKILNPITYTDFSLYAEKLKDGTAGAGILDENIRNATLYNYNFKKISFNSLLETYNQPYIYLDFCGSWCKPCIEEIAEYVTTKKYDTSAIIKPYWIFFENNKNDWLKIIAKYKLKKENCFLAVKDTVIQKYFNTQFLWNNTFPYHFIFTNRGRLVMTNAETLSNLNINILINK